MTYPTITHYTTSEGGTWEEFPMLQGSKDKPDGGVEYYMHRVHVPRYVLEECAKGAHGDKIRMHGIMVHAIRLSDGRIWDCKNGFRGQMDPRPVKTVRYYCQTADAEGKVKTEDVTTMVNELVKASKELASIVIANKVVMNNLKGQGNAQGTDTHS